MKKFMKSCGITALVMIVVGSVLAGVISLIMGTGFIDNDFIGKMFGARVQEWLENGNVEIYDGYITGFNDFEEYVIEDSMVYSEEYETHQGNVYYTFEGGNVTELNLNIGGCRFFITESDNDTFYVEGDNIGKIQTYQENGIINVIVTRKGKNWNDFNDSSLTLYVPSGYRFENVNLEMGAGTMEIDLDDFSVGTIKLSAGAGQIYVENLTADFVTATAGAGDVHVDNLISNGLDAVAEAGHIYMSGLVQGNIKGNSAAGSMELILDGIFEDYNYQLTSSVGSIDLDGMDFAGLDKKRTINNGADREVDLSCSAGTISVEFYE